jgi:hypothetical protein
VFTGSLHNNDRGIHGHTRPKILLLLRVFVVAEPLPSNDKGIHIQAHRSHDIRVCTKFYIDLLRHSEVNRGDSQTHIQHGDCISLLSFFKIKKVG